MLKEIVGMTKVANYIHATKIMWSTDSKPLIASQPRGSPGFSMRGPTWLPATFRFRELRPAPAIPRTAPCLRRSRQVLQVAYERPVRMYLLVISRLARGLTRRESHTCSADRTKVTFVSKSAWRYLLAACRQHRMGTTYVILSLQICLKIFVSYSCQLHISWSE